MLTVSLGPFSLSDRFQIIEVVGGSLNGVRTPVCLSVCPIRPLQQQTAADGFAAGAAAPRAAADAGSATFTADVGS